MHKFTPTWRSIWLCAFGLLVSSGVQAATPGIDSLKASTIRAFLQQANNPKTSLHQKLVDLNQADGRNVNGIFPKTLAAKDIQVMSIDGENQFGSYCSGITNKPNHFKCASGVTETYLISILAKMGVRKATSYPSFLFVVTASKNMEWNRDDKDRQYNYKESIKISEPVQIPIEKLIPDR